MGLLVSKTPRKAGLVQSVDRALALLEALSASPDGLPLVQLSASSGLNVSTCHHLLATLANRGYVVQDPGTKRYFLGNQILQLQYGRTQQMDLVSQVMPILQRLNLETREAVHLAVLEANDLVTLAKLESLQAVKVDGGFVGKVKAAHATATGKAILAYITEAELDAFVQVKHLHRFTERTITTLDELKADLQQVRVNGHSVDNEEFQPGVFCIGVPIWDHRRRVMAAISCSVPLMRINEAGLHGLIALVKCAAQEMSERMGYVSD